MHLSRRTFLVSAAASAGFGLCARAVPRKDSPLVRIGVLSDSHVTSDPETAEPLRRIFADFSAKGVDVVMHAGDICHLGDLDELSLVADAWKGAFKGGLNAAGGKVTPFFAFGNHDYHRASFQSGKGNKADGPDPSKAIVRNKDAAWRLLTGEKFPGEVFSKNVKGFTFVGAHWGHEKDLADFFREHPDPDPSKPVFYVQHPHPKGTCFGEWATGVAHANAELMRHPNLFAVSGHSHVSCAEDCGLWQGGFVSMGAGSARLPGPGNISSGGFDNGNPRPWPEGLVLHSPSVSGGKAWQASVVTVFSNRVVVDRYDYLAGESLGEPWEVEFPFRHDAAKPYRIANAAKAPAFPEGAKVDISKIAGKRRPDRVAEEQIRVRVPTALGDGPYARTIFYRFAALDAATGAKLLEKSILQDWLTCSERRAATRGARCSFVASEFPAGAKVKFSVTPFNAADLAGRPILSGEFAV